MDEAIFDFLKPVKEDLSGKSQEEILLLIIQQAQADKKALSQLLSVLYENQYYLHALNLQAIRLLAEKLSRVYEIDINCDDLLAEARILVDACWQKTKTQIKELNEFMRIVEP